MKYKAFYFIAFLMTTQLSMAQKRSANDTVFNQSVTIEREYNPIFKDANRIVQLPVVVDSKIDRSPIQFQFGKPETAIPLQWKTTWPDKKMSNYPFSTQKGYIDLGLGAPTNTLGHGGIVLVNNETDQLNLSFNHRIINDKRAIAQSNEKPTVFSTDNRIGTNYSHLFEPFRLLFSADYGHTAFNYFGEILGASSALNNQIFGPNMSVLAATPLTISNRNQIYNYFTLQGYGVSYDESALKFKAGVKYNYFNKKFGASADISGTTENNIELMGELSGTFSKTSRIGLDATINNFIYSGDKGNQLPGFEAKSYGILDFTPHYDFTAELFKARIGIKSQFIFANDMRVNFAPSMSADWQFAPKFNLLADIGGGTHIYSFRETDALFRYIDPSVRLKDTHTPLDATFSLQSNAISRLTFELFVGYKTGDEYYFSPLKQNSITSNIWKYTLFPALQATTSDTKVGLGAKYQLEKWGNIQMRLTKHTYNVKLPDNFTVLDGGKAWDKPEFEFNIDADIQATDEINVQVNYLLASGRSSLKYETGGFSSVKLSPIHQLNLNGRYSFNKTWSAFLQLNNILFQKYDLWYGMPAQNFNFVAGVGFSF